MASLPEPVLVAIPNCLLHPLFLLTLQSLFLMELAGTRARWKTLRFAAPVVAQDRANFLMPRLSTPRHQNKLALCYRLLHRFDFHLGLL